MNEWVNMPEFVLGYQAREYRPVCRLQRCCPSWTVPAQSMDALSFPIISSPLHSMPSLYSCLGFSAFFWSVSEDFCLNDPLRTTGPSFVMTSSLIWVNELNMSLYPNQISCVIIHPSIQSWTAVHLCCLSKWTRPASASQDESCTKNSLVFSSSVVVNVDIDCEVRLQTRTIECLHSKSCLSS